MSVTSKKIEATPNTTSSIDIHVSDAARRWAGWALARLDFGSSVKPITTKGTDYAHPITACPPKFETLAASLHNALVSNR